MVFGLTLTTLTAKESPSGVKSLVIPCFVPINPMVILFILV